MRWEPESADRLAVLPGGQAREIMLRQRDASSGWNDEYRNLASVWVGGLNDLAASRRNGVTCRGRTGNHDVRHQARLGRHRSAECANRRPVRYVGDAVVAMAFIASLHPDVFADETQGAQAQRNGADGDDAEQ